MTTQEIKSQNKPENDSHTGMKAINFDEMFAPLFKEMGIDPNKKRVDWEPVHVKFSLHLEDD